MEPSHNRRQPFPSKDSDFFVPMPEEYKAKSGCRPKCCFPVALVRQRTKKRHAAMTFRGAQCQPVGAYAETDDMAALAPDQPRSENGTGC